MRMVERWLSAKMSTEKFDPFWAGFFMGVVCCLMVVTGLVIIYLNNIGPGGRWIGGGLLTGAALSFAVQMVQNAVMKRRSERRI